MSDPRPLEDDEALRELDEFRADFHGVNVLGLHPVFGGEQPLGYPEHDPEHDTVGKEFYRRLPMKIKRGRIVPRGDQ